MEHDDQPPAAEGEQILSRDDLLAAGYSAKKITKAVRDGTLTRLRRDHYVLDGDGDNAAKAVRVGGRLTCVSAISAVSEDVFVFRSDHVHVHVERAGSRLRKADDSTGRWSRETANDVRLSWGDLTETPVNRHLVALADAIRSMVRCLPEREAIATLDSLLHLGLLTMMQLRDAIASLPARQRRISSRVDRRSESGTESFMRVILTQIGVGFDVQVKIRGVGRVDFVVDGFLIIECDSKAFHEGWERQRADRKRDLAAAARGYFTFRVLAEDLMHDPQAVEAAIRALLATRQAQAVS